MDENQAGPILLWPRLSWSLVVWECDWVVILQAVVSDVTNRQAFLDLGGLPIAIHTLLQTCPEVPPATHTPTRLCASRLKVFGV